MVGVISNTFERSLLVGIIQYKEPMCSHTYSMASNRISRLFGVVVAMKS